MKILFAVDGSAQALGGLNSLDEKFRCFRETPQLTLLQVHAPVPYKAAAAWVGKETIERFYVEESEEALAGAREFLTRAGISFDVDKRVGEAAIAAQPSPSRKLRSFSERDGWRSLRSAFASIWRMRSRVTSNCLPTSSSV